MHVMCKCMYLATLLFSLSNFLRILCVDIHVYVRMYTYVQVSCCTQPNTYVIKFAITVQKDGRTETQIMLIHKGLHHPE